MGEKDLDARYRIPLGIRITILLLDAFAVLLGLLLIGLGFNVLFAFRAVEISASHPLYAFVISGLAFVLFEVPLAMCLSTCWTATLFRSRYPFHYPRTWPPDHPVRAIGRPLAVATAILSGFALVFWIFARLTGGDPGWAWLLAWGALGASSILLVSWINRRGNSE